MVVAGSIVATSFADTATSFGAVVVVVLAVVTPFTPAPNVTDELLLDNSNDDDDDDDATTALVVVPPTRNADLIDLMGSGGDGSVRFGLSTR